MTKYLGPVFQLVDTVAAGDFIASGGFRPRARPVLVKGAVKGWPASDTWTFRNFAKLRHRDGSDPIVTFQNGLVEQGVTRDPLRQHVSPYLRELDGQAAHAGATRPDDIGLCPDRVWKRLAPGTDIHLDWDYMRSFTPDKVYLGLWDILKEFPELRNDCDIGSLWKGWHKTWEYVFIGPAHTVTGLHHDFPNSWFCQIRGTKEFLLFPPDSDPYMCESRKYDWGATVSDIDISRLSDLPSEAASFAKVRGFYARCESGDALFVPKRTWHCVVALEPSISLSVFGLTPAEILLGGGAAEFFRILHSLHLYRWGNCTCHPTRHDRP